MSENGLNIGDKQATAIEEIKKEETSKKSKASVKNAEFKTKECKIISYNQRTNALDVLFDNYGIRIADVKGLEDSNIPTINIKYKGEIGKPDFEYRL